MIIYGVFLLNYVIKNIQMNMTKILTHTLMIIIRSMVKHTIRVLLRIYPVFRGSDHINQKI
jgi:hypothetical protein